jgi:hypothetical protein
MGYDHGTRQRRSSDSPSARRAASDADDGRLSRSEGEAQHWKTLGKRARQAAIESHWFPAVLGPGGLHYITDHHHLGLALIEEGETRVNAMLLKDLSWLDDTIFWRIMEHNQWVHPFGPDGARREYAHLPQALTGLEDDPYRSLAGELRTAGGYAKDATPFSEFLWPTTCAST